MKVRLGLVLLLGCYQVYSQSNFGELNTPYAGVHALGFNPAEIVDSRYKFHMNLAGANIALANNFISARKELLSFSPPSLDSAGKYKYLPMNLDGKPKHVYVQSHIQGPSFLMNLGRKNKFAFAISSGAKMLLAANNVNEKLAAWIYDNKNRDYYVPAESKDFGVNTSGWAYIGATLGTVIWERPKFALKGAITGKMNFGLWNTYANTGSLYLSPIATNLFDEAHTTTKIQFATPFIQNNEFKTDKIKFGTTNTGFGMDAGIIFEKRDKGEYNYTFDCLDDNPRKDLNKYRYRIGASVSDWGFVKWNPTRTTTRAFSVDSSFFRFLMNTKSFNRFAEPQAIIDTIAKYGYNGFSVDTTVENYFMATPASANVFVDVHIYKGIYVAANMVYGFVGNNYASSWIQNTHFTFTPRLEGKNFGLYLPQNYNMLAQEFNSGIAGRIFCLNLLLQDWISIAGLKEKTKNFGFHVSVNIPFHQRPHPADKDGDLMSNRKDKCKNFAGDCNSGGCPEADDDGDGVANSQDKCPSHKGPAKLDGCPDADEDGVPDSKDRCPKQKGKYENGGCPDKDGDGIIDQNDKCPTEKGSMELEGCPDTDNDRIPNHLDECPLDSGIFENKGCPEVKVVDSDNDGIEDEQDKCPTVQGPKSNNGCPIPREALNIAKVAQEKLEFQTGSAVIKKESLESLALLAGYLSKNPNIKVTLSGHTDNVGKPDKNLKLSNDRALSVKNFFISKGIDEGRISAAGYGDTQPIGDNTTVSGRAVNRRVEIDLK